MRDDLPTYLEIELDLLGVVPERVTPKQPQEKQELPKVWDGKGDCPF